MDILNRYLRTLLLTTSCMLMLCICFAINPELANGVVIGELSWFNITLIALSASFIYAELTTDRREFRFKLTDMTLLLIFIASIITYNKAIDPKPEKFYFVIQLVCLWFILRALFNRYKELRTFSLIIIMLTGIIGSLMGIMIYFNPDYLRFSVLALYRSLMFVDASSVYLVIICPLCLSFILSFWNCKKSNLFNTNTLLFYTSVLGLVLIVFSLSVASDPHIIAAIVISTLWIFWMRSIGIGKTQQFITNHKRLFALGSMLLFTGLTLVVLYGIFKQAESGDIQLLVWNVSTKAIMEKPLFGYGLGMFPKVFAETQSAYFASGIALESEKLNAFCPIGANNELLQIGVEIGIVGLICTILFCGSVLYYGIQNRHFASTGSFVAIIVFSMYTNCLDYPSLWVIALFIAVVCVTKPQKDKPDHQLQQLSKSVGLLAAIIAIVLSVIQWDIYSNYKQWRLMQRIYETQNYELGARKYTDYFKHLKHQPQFVYEGAACYSNTNNSEMAILWLKDILRISAEPKLYYAMVENRIKLKHYQEAERYLIEVAQILPRRGETFLYFMRLYSLKDNIRPKRFEDTANLFFSLINEPKSGITPEMQQEGEALRTQILTFTKENTSENRDNTSL